MTRALACWLACVLLAACSNEPASGGQRGSVVKGKDAAAEDDADVAPAPPPGLAPHLEAVLDTECATAAVRARIDPTNLLFVLDRSSSMACNPPPRTDSARCEADPVREDHDAPSKWELTRAALVDALDRLPPTTVVGIGYFSNDDGCGVSATPTVLLRPLFEAQREEIAMSLMRIRPAGATPLVGATVLAYDHLHGLALDGSIVGNKFVVLLTDGAQSENCSDPNRCDGAEECTRLLVDEEVPRAAGAGVGIQTFVIGVPGSEPARKTLSEIAVAGGTAPDGCDVEAGECHFDMTREADFGDALLTALREISGRAIQCEFPLPFDTDSVDPERINLVYAPSDGSGARLILYDDHQPCERSPSGWQYGQGGRTIRLCGADCSAARADANARVDVVLGCPIVVPQ
jgi:hypothetical protein